MDIHINWRGLLGLPSKYLGVVYNKETRVVCSVINPSYDNELLDPCWTKNGEFDLLKMMRKTKDRTYSSEMSFDDFERAIREAQEILNDPSRSNNF
jgi:hypothetical protein